MSLEQMVNCFPNRETFENTNAILARIAGALENGGGKVYETNFAEVNKNVNLGLGPILYPVGTEFVAYKAHTAVASAGGQNTGVTSVSINAETFLSAIDTVDRKVKVFEYNGAWYYNGEAVNPSTYGLTLTGTPATGDTILVNMTCTKIIWVVRAHNHHATVSGAKYTMTIEMKWLYGTDTTYKAVVFDAPEAFYTHESDTALAVGTYHFNLPTTYDKWAAGNYQFTTAKTHPKGAQFCLSGYASTALTSLKVRIYDGGFNDTVVSEELTITSGNGGTSLGAMGTELNHWQRVSYGSNNNAQSNCRQFLNSTAPQGSVCKQMTKYDRKPSWETGSDNAYAGFLHGMGRDFLNAIATAVVPCRTNNVFETNSLDGTAFATGQTYNLHDKVFLLSRGEIWGTYDSASLKDGTLLEFYDGLTNLERIKYDEFGVARTAWVRTPDASGARGECSVSSTTGAVGVNGAYKDSVVGYESNCMKNTYRLRQSLLDGTYKIDPYQHFKVHEPKERDIVATRIKDRQFQRSLCDNGFYDQITRSFITDNCACLKGRGVDYTLNRLTCHLRRYRQEHGSEGWVLKCDIHHYFQSINHEVACRAIRKRVKDTQIADRACEVVNSFGGVRGIGLGSQISQLVALAVLDDLDHFVKERLRIKHYIRYMDDFVLIHPDKAYLQYCLTEIEREVNKIGLFLHPNKTKISPLRQGVKLLQWRYIISDSGKIVRKMGKNKLGRQRRKLRKIYAKERKGLYRVGTTEESLRSWLANAKRGDTWFSQVKMQHYYERLEESTDG